MLIESPAKNYKVIGRTFYGAANDSYICTVFGSGNKKRYAVNVISDRELIKKLIAAFHSTARCRDCFECFTWRNFFCVVFAANESRNFEKFLPAKIPDCGTFLKIARNIVLECMTFQVPYPVLDLIIRQKKLNLFCDGKISFDCCLDFKNFDSSVTEKDCVQDTAEFLLQVCRRCSMTHLALYPLIERRTARNGYGSFPELYGDLKNTGISFEKIGFFERLCRFFKKRGTTIFNIVKYLLAALTVVAMLALICQFIFGDVPFFRIFTNTFRKIGERTLGD